MEEKLKALRNLVDAEDIKAARHCEKDDISGMLLTMHIRELMGWELCEEARETWAAFHQEGDQA